MLGPVLNEHSFSTGQPVPAGAAGTNGAHRPVHMHLFRAVYSSWSQTCPYCYKPTCEIVKNQIEKVCRLVILYPVIPFVCMSKNIVNKLVLYYDLFDFMNVVG